MNPLFSNRLHALETALRDPALLSGRGLGNEIGFYIFDYPAEQEPSVRAFLPRLRERLGLRVLELNLYTLLLEVIEGRGLLDKSLALERSKGSPALFHALKGVVRPESLIERMELYLEQQDWQQVWLTGIGAAWPLVRSHTVLNNLHAHFDQVPLVAFFPGEYTGQELRLFGTFRDDHYYRAFRLLPQN